jgi:hypothetical protein
MKRRKALTDCRMYCKGNWGKYRMEGKEQKKYKQVERMARSWQVQSAFHEKVPSGGGGGLRFWCDSGGKVY